MIGCYYNEKCEIRSNKSKCPIKCKLTYRKYMQDLSRIRKKKILCCCAYGIVRSVACARIIKNEYGQEAKAIGLKTASDQELKRLYDWADVIIILDKELVSLAPDYYKDKTFLINIGPDRWHDPGSKDLEQTIRAKLQQPQIKAILK